MTINALLIAGLLAAMSTGVIAADRQTDQPLAIEDAALASRFHIEGVPPAISPDGRWVSATVCDPNRIVLTGKEDSNISTKGAAYRSQGCDIWLFATSGKRKARNLTASNGNNWGATWSPDEAWLAFYSDRDGEPRLWLWNRARDDFRLATRAVMQHWLGFQGAPLWTPDSRSVVVTIRPPEMEAAPDKDPTFSAPAGTAATSATVVVFESPKLPTEAKSMHPLKQTTVAVVDIGSGAVRELIPNIDTATMLLSPDGKKLLHLSPRASTGDRFMDLRVLDVQTGKGRVLVNDVLQDFSGAVSWAPDSRRIAYTSIDAEQRNAAINQAANTSLTKQGGDLYVLDTQSGQSAKFQHAPVNHFGVDFLPPMWDRLGENIYLLSADGQVWRIDASSFQGQQLTHDGQRKKLILVSGPTDNIVGSSDERYLYVTTRNTENAKAGLIRIDRSTGVQVPQYEDDITMGETFIPPILNSSQSSLLFISESGSRSADLWMSDLEFRHPRRLTQINSKLDRYHFGKSRLVNFVSADGVALKAGVLLPPDYRPGTRCPTVLWVYASDSETARHVNSFGLVPMEAFNMQMLATRGYAVVWPDIPTHPRTPMKDLMKAVMPAIDQLVALGIADPDRLAVMGNSNGGYSTLALITQTDRFKAAIMNSGFGDLTAFYGTADGAWIPWLERSGGSMHGAPWALPFEYVENSPVYFLDRINTPLIMQAGAADIGIINHSDEVWVDLQSLKKAVTYLRYGGEGHVLASGANLKDYWSRILQFLEKHMSTSGISVQDFTKDVQDRRSAPRFLPDRRH
jgi:dipeptidyl aminopeptidase/acylaminoacyl peptidase